MGYLTKYELCIPSLTGEKYRLLLQKSEYSGPSYVVKGSADPAIIQMPNKKRKFDPITGQELKIELIHEPSVTEYDLRGDFEDISNREWRADLYLDTDGQSYQASGGITELSIADTGVSPFAIFDNLIIPTPIVTDLATDFTFTLTQNSLSGGNTEGINLFIHLNGSLTFESANTIQLAQVSVEEGDTTESIIDKFVAAYSDITKVDANTLRYTVPSNPTGKFAEITGRSKMSISNPIWFGSYATSSQPSIFYSTEAHYLDFAFRLRVQGDVYTTLQLARYRQGTELETPNDVWAEVASQIGTTTIENVILDDYPDQPITFRIKASVVTGTPSNSLKLEILDIDTKGNGIGIKRLVTYFSSHLLITTDDFNNSYRPSTAWPTEFAGGVQGTDTFTFDYTGAGGGSVSVLAGVTDTKATIIAALVEEINRQNALLRASINPTDDSAFLVETNEDMSLATYDFTYTPGTTPYAVGSFEVIATLGPFFAIDFGQINIATFTGQLQVSFALRTLSNFASGYIGILLQFYNDTTLVDSKSIEQTASEAWLNYNFAISASGTFTKIILNIYSDSTSAVLNAGGVAQIKDLAIVDGASNPITPTSIVGLNTTYTEESAGGSTVYDNGPSWAQVSGRELYFTGFLSPALNQEKHIPGATVLSLSAVCGLAELKNFTFEVNNRRPFEKLPLLTFLQICLSRTNLGLDIYESFDLWFEGADPNTSPLLQAYEDSSRWNGATIYTVLESICFTTKATIMQRYGHWELRPLEYLNQDSLSYRVFNAQGTYLSTITDAIHKKTVGSCTPRPFLGANATLLKKPAFRQLEVTQNYGFVPQLIKFPNFSNLTENITEAGYNPQYPWTWTNDGIVTTSYATRIVREDDGLLKINDARNQPNAFELRQLFIIGNIDNNQPKERSFELKVEYEANPSGIFAATSFQIQLIITRSDGTSYYLFEEDPENPVENPLSISEKIITIDAFAEDGPILRTFSQTFDYPFLESIADGQLVILQPTADLGFVRIKSAKIELNASVENTRKTVEYFIDQDAAGTPLNERTTSKIEKIKASASDVPAINGGAQLYKNALFGIANNRPFTTTAWTKTPLAPEPEYDAIIAYLRSFWINEYAIPFYELNATIQGVSIWDELIDKTKDDFIYTPIGGQWNLRLGRAKGKWQQIDLKNAYLSFPTQRVIEILPTEADSGGDNSYTGSSGGTAGTGGTEIIVESPVQSVNNKTGEVQLTTDDIPEAVNKYVNATGKVIAERGGRIIEDVLSWNGILYTISFYKERLKVLSVQIGVTSIQLGLSFATDSNSYSRRILTIIDNSQNNQIINNLEFNEANGNWIWEDNSPPTSIGVGEKYLLVTENVNNASVVAKMVKITGSLSNDGIGFWIIEDTFIVS